MHSIAYTKQVDSLLQRVWREIDLRGQQNSVCHFFVITTFGYHPYLLLKRSVNTCNLFVQLFMKSVSSSHLHCNSSCGKNSKKKKKDPQR